MARKLFIIFLIIFILFNFCVLSYAEVSYYGSIADYCPVVGISQGATSISSDPIPTEFWNSPSGESTNWSRSCIFWTKPYGLVLMGCNDTSDNYTGYISYTLSGNKAQVTNYTNITYYLYYRDTNNRWNYFQQLNTNSTFTASENQGYWSSDTPFPYVGKEVLIRQNNQGAYVWANYVSSTLRISSNAADIENAGIDYPVIFDNAEINIGLNNFKAYVAVSFQASSDTSNWEDMSYTILTNNSAIYNSTTHSFYITLQSLINRDLAIGDKIRIEYGWSTLDRLGNVHSFRFYNIYTRSTAYVGGSAYEPVEPPSDDGGGSNDSPDYTEQFGTLDNSINDQTQAINDQTQAINDQTNVVSGFRDDLLNQNTTDPNSIAVDDNTQNNTADLTNIFNTLSNMFSSRDSNIKTFTLTLPNGDSFAFTLPRNVLRDFINSNNVLSAFWDAFWYIVFGGYIIFDFKKIYNKFKNGDFEGAMNSSSVDNVVKEALR